MNVKCPNCRFKFDIKQIDTNSNNEVNCTCPRCGKTFMAQNADVAAEQPHSPVQPIASSVNDMSVQSLSQESEMDLYYALMNRMEAGQHDAAGAYLAKLLELNPNEPMYLKIKEDLDKIKQSYFMATKYIQSGQLNLAKLYINDLLNLAPNHPMFMNLKERLLQAEKEETQRQEKQSKPNNSNSNNDSNQEEVNNFGVTCGLVLLLAVGLLIIIITIISQY